MSANELGQFTGTRIPTSIFSTGSSVLLKFTSDLDYMAETMIYTGFYIYYDSGRRLLC